MIATGSNPMVIRRPQAVWSRPLKFDVKEFLKAVSKGALSTVMADTGAVRDAAIDGAASIGLERHTPGELAWELLSTALQSATHETFVAVAQRSEELSGWEELLQSMQHALDRTETPLSKAFFSDPAATDTYRAAEAAVVEWASRTLGSSRAEAIGRRLRSQFVHALYAEWHAHPDRYAPVEDALANPFDRPAAAEMSWRAYHAWLEAALDEPLLHEPFGLRDIYVPPTGTLKSKPEVAAGQRRESRAPKSVPDGASARVERRALSDVVDTVAQWANGGVVPSRLLVISGGPGSGKSSLTKIAAARCTHESTTQVLTIPLHMLDLDETVPLETGIRSFALSMPGAPAVVLTAERTDPLLLIFDGLDELVLRGRSGLEAAQLFLEKLERMLSRLNADRRSAGVRALLTCREILVQGLSRVLDNAPMIEIHNFTEQQRNAWWANYGRLKSLPLDGYPADLAREDINELTVQPLLNHLIAFAYTNRRIDFTKPQTLNSLYGTVLHAVYDRVWTDGRRHVSTRGLTFDEFVLILGEIALCTWWGDGRTASEQDVRDLCARDGIEHLLPEFETAARWNMLQLLTAFYFRYTGTATERTFEFTHKTFAEYLVVKRIVAAVADVADRLLLDEKAADLDDVFLRWFNVCGPHVLDAYMIRFLKREIALVDRKTCSTWAAALARLLEYVIAGGADVQFDTDASFQAARTQMRTAEETLVTTASAVAARGGSRISLRHFDDSALTHWIGRLRAEPIHVPDAMFTGSMVMFDFSDSTLNHADLHNMDFSRSWFNRTELRYVSFVMSVCAEASFENANLTGTAFTSANLTGAVLRRAKLHHVIFDGAYLRYADAAGAIFFRASFIGADLSEVNFERTDFIQCDFSDAILENTRFSNAVFTNCIRNERAFPPSHCQTYNDRGDDSDSANGLDREEPQAR